MFRRLFLVISLALLLGLGQQGAGVHAISHLADTQQDQKSHHLSFCDQCAAYAALDNLIDADARYALPSNPARTIFIAGTSPCPTDHKRYYAARAPPFLA